MFLKVFGSNKVRMFQTILKQIGSLQIILGLLMILPLAVSLIYGEYYSALGFLLSGLIILLIGFSLYRGFFNSPEPKNKHALIIAASGWLFIALMGALPFIIIAYITPESVMESMVPAGADYTSSILFFKDPLNAIFESMSALTTTGYTMAVREPSIGKGLLFYRSWANWIGGAGFIVLSLAILKQAPGLGAVMLYGSEASGEKLKPNVVGTARAIWKTYLGLTIFLILYLIIGTYLILPDYKFSENVFDSFCHAMSGIATGGFSTLDNSIADYHSQAIEILYLLPMFLGAISLPFFFKVIAFKKINLLWKDIQTRAIIIACIFGSIGLSLLLLDSGYTVTPFREGVFQFISALSTTGWQTSNIGAWDDVSVVFIVCAAMIIGGAAGSTVGGIKVIRSLLILKGIRWQVNKVFIPNNGIYSVFFNGRKLLPDEMNRELAKATTFSFLFLVLILISTMITSYFMADGYTLADAFFESVSAQSTVGLSTGITDPSMSPVIKITYIIQMWVGRLEIIPVLVLFRALIWGTKARMI